MTAKEISEKYDIPLSILEKMKEDSKTGSCFRKYQQEINYNKYFTVKVVVRSGGEFEVNEVPMPIIRGKIFSSINK